MPLDNGAGYSEDTAVKQRDFGYVIGVMLKVAKSCMQKSWAHKEFLYFDFNAGPGIVGGQDGSPLIFAETAFAIGLPFRSFLFEKNQDAARLLADEINRRWLGADERRRFKVITSDHKESVPWVLDQYLAALPEKWVYGLGYGDGNGKTDAPFGPMAAIARRFPQVDLLLNVNATVYKRLRGANPDAGFLLDELGAIEKRRRLIRQPVGIHQWTMVFQTNWDKPPEFEQIGFRRIDSFEGQRIASLVNFRKPERGEGGDRPFGVRPPHPIGPMPSISGIRASSPSGPLPSSDVAASANGVAPLALPSPTT